MYIPLSLPRARGCTRVHPYVHAYMIQIDNTRSIMSFIYCNRPSKTPLTVCFLPTHHYCISSFIIAIIALRSSFLLVKSCVPSVALCYRWSSVVVDRQSWGRRLRVSLSCPVVVETWVASMTVSRTRGSRTPSGSIAILRST